MLLQVFRLAVGLFILAFHRQIAEFVMAQERSLLLMFRQRGLRFPDVPTQTAATIYFLLGLFVCTLQFFRIWSSLPGH